MSRYENFDSMVGDPIFEKFIKQFGYEKSEKISVLDHGAIFFAFKERMQDLSQEEKEYENKLLNKDPDDEVKAFAAKRFNKPYEELSEEEKIFICLSFMAHKRAEMEAQNQDQGGQSNNGGDGDGQDNTTNLDDMKRIRSDYSDCNEQWIRWERLAALKAMGVVKEDLPQMLDVVATIDLMQKYESSLSEKQEKEMTARVTNKILSDDNLFELVPPSILSSMYEDFKEVVNKEKDKEKRLIAEKKLKKISDRMDGLAEMVAKNQVLYFADPTNIADVYKGYNEMFAARYNDLMDDAVNGATDEEKTSASTKLKYHQDMLQIATNKMNEYDSTYNLENISAENAEALDKRFDEMRQAIEGVEISPETAKLVANFKFLDREYFSLDLEQLQVLQDRFPNKDFSAIKTYDMLNSAETSWLEEKGLMPHAEPQFIDKNGNVSDKWTEGSKVIPGSKLDKAILAAKQSVMLSKLGTDDEITPELLQKELDAQLPKTLYALHVVDSVIQGALENPDQYTNPEYLNKFINDLSNAERPMAIGPISFEAGIDNIVNQTGGYAERLADRLGFDKDGNKVENPNINVATKLFEPIESIDKNAKDRIAMKASGKQGYWKNVGKTFISSATMSCAMRLVGTAAQSVSGLTWAAPAVSSVIGVGLTLYQIKKWNKERQKAGLGTGFKDFMKDRRMLMTVATTTLGCAATACMAFPGAQPVGIVLGGAAMVIGATNGAVTAYKAARASGESKWKSAWKALGVVGASALGALMGKVTADTAIDAYNKYDPDNKIFQHEKLDKVYKIKESDGTSDTRETVIDRDALEADSKRYNEQYNISDRVHHGMNHDEYMNAVNDYNKAHPESPITNPDELLKGAYNSQHGRVYGPGYVAEHGLDPNVVKAVGNLINSDGTINPDAVKAWNNSDLWRQSGLNNFVQSVNEPVELRPDLYPNRNPESTYSGTNMPTKEVVTSGTEPTYRYEPHYVSVDNDRPLGFAMVGVLGEDVTKKKTLKERIGSLFDQLLGRKPVENIIPSQGKDSTSPEGQGRTPSEGQNDNQNHVDGEKKKKYISPKVGILPLDEGLLRMEYRMIYGRKPNKQELKTYRTLVNAELLQAKNEGTVKPDENINGFLRARFDEFEEQIKQSLGDKEDTPKNRGYIIREARKTMENKFKSSFDEKGNKTSRIYPTLKHLIVSVPQPKSQGNRRGIDTKQRG